MVSKTQKEKSGTDLFIEILGAKKENNDELFQKLVINLEVEHFEEIIKICETTLPAMKSLCKSRKKMDNILESYKDKHPKQ